MRIYESDIVIVGAGMVGLACAQALAKKGFRCIVLEAGKIKKDYPTQDSPFDAKVVAITRATEQFFTQNGIWPYIQAQRICAYQKMVVWDNVADGVIQFLASDFFEPNLGYIIEQQVILGALHQGMSQLDVTLLSEISLERVKQEEEFIEGQLSNGEIVRARLMIGADGANSGVRKLCNLGTTGWAYEQSAIVATVKAQKSHQNTAFQRFSQDGPLALLPLSDPFHCSIVWTTSLKQAQTLLEVSESEFAKVLSQECNQVLGDMALAGKRYAFDLHTHHALAYASHRCVLVGDAAHTLHPLAGQGVNLGLMDVAALVEVLSQTKKKQRDYGQVNYLQRYQRARKMHNQVMIWAMELFKRGFATQLGVIQAIRNAGLNWVDKQTMLKQLFAKIALGTINPASLKATIVKADDFSARRQASSNRGLLE